MRGIAMKVGAAMIIQTVLISVMWYWLGFSAGWDEATKMFNTNSVNESRVLDGINDCSERLQVLRELRDFTTMTKEGFASEN